MSVTETRNFPVSDYDVLVGGAVILRLYEEDEGLFANYSKKHYPETVKVTLKELIATGHSIQDDTMVRQDQSMITEELNANIAEFKKLYLGLSMFIDTAFVNEPVKKEQLGIGTITKQTKTQDDYLQFVNSFALLLRRYIAPLKNAGCPEERIVAVEKLNERLKKSREERDMFRVTRQNKTVSRVVHFNRIWDVLESINRGAKVVHADNPTRLAQYELPKRKRSTETDGDNSSDA